MGQVSQPAANPRLSFQVACLAHNVPRCFCSIKACGMLTRYWVISGPSQKVNGIDIGIFWEELVLFWPLLGTAPGP